jgi:hypothetical protein
VLNTSRIGLLIWTPGSVEGTAVWGRCHRRSLGYRSDEARQLPGAGNVAGTIATLQRLVAFDTSRRNIELIDWVANRLDDHGVPVLVQHGDGRARRTSSPRSVPTNGRA